MNSEVGESLSTVGPTSTNDAASTASDPASDRVRVEGKFFRLGAVHFPVKGVTYGPFGPEEDGREWPAPEQVARDLDQLGDLGANLLRVYYTPPAWFLDQVEAAGFKVLVDVPWAKHLCFHDRPELRESARRAVMGAARSCAGHPAVLAISVVNEIPPDIVRWIGARQLEEFIDELADIVKDIDPACLVTFANFPPTEFLSPANIDFLCYNVYLHDRLQFESYLARLQMLADARPLVIGEFGIDSLREGEDRQAEILGWQLEAAFRGGAAGSVVFSYTDDWWRGGGPVTDWAFGLTTRDRQPRPSFNIVRQAFNAAPCFELPYYPKVSVVVASYNGEATLQTCLESLERLNYPHYEVILVDDGSTDSTPRIAARFPGIRSLRLPRNQGLSSARNEGIAAADGEIVAFTDSDCRADENWLHYLVGDLLNSQFAGIGGPNFLPADDSWVAASVMASPGGPAHVMLTDRIAEHIPGCNMAFYKWALEEIGGFDPIYHRAGDDVDVCWRLQERGYRLGFSPAAFVWHYRRSNIRAYLRQQQGYGEAEALLVRKHPEYFNALGGAMWQGRIYTSSRLDLVVRPPIIYHGAFASGAFQSIYQPPAAGGWMFLTSLEFHVLATLPLLVLGIAFPFLLVLAAGCLGAGLTVCSVAALQADLPRRRQRFWSRPLVGLLFFLQPFVRGWSRYRGRLRLDQPSLDARETLDTLDVKERSRSHGEVNFWAEQGVDRFDFVRTVLAALDHKGWHYRPDAGWAEFDLEIHGNRWCHLHLVTAVESYDGGRQMLRCRLASGWSLLAKVVFWVLSVASLVVLVRVPDRLPWFCLLIGLLLLYAWRLQRDADRLRRLIASFLVQTVEPLGLIRVLSEPEPGPAPE